ncbi:testis-specific serine/threonine-protein kinase 6-like [Amphiura filiformis]|uniref:testis-specific serine/threonine-protein kinase 6-like n=1 Tax=Amphiura filiformis TaxID=82378 RepID=UPI003B219221
MAAPGRHSSLSDRPGVATRSTSSKLPASGDGPTDQQVMNAHGYYLGERLGSGSYSKVRLGIYKRNFNKVAVKIIDRLRAPVDYQRDFLPRELSLVKTLKNPHIVETYDWFEANNKIYMIMELAKRGDVLEYVRCKSKGPVPEQLSRKWTLQTAGALTYLHCNNIAHRDVKCENLLLDGNKNIKLSDFGFVRIMAPSGSELSNTYCGSAAYASPQIIRSEAYNPYLSDVWALGVVIYILVTGYMPFGDDVRNISKILDSQKKGVMFPPAKPGRVVISEECKDLVRATLRVEPDMRLDMNGILRHEWLKTVSKVSSSSSKN